MTTMTAPTSLENIEVRRIDGTLETMAKYRGQVLLIVNVASRCAFTKQYAGLESLYQEYRERGLVVMGFPCDQFGHQEPGDESTIQAFCSTTYNVSFRCSAKSKSMVLRSSALSVLDRAMPRSTRNDPHSMELHQVSGRSTRESVQRLRR